MKLPKFRQNKFLKILETGLFILIVGLVITGIILSVKYYQDSQHTITALNKKLSQVQIELTALKNQDQYKRNNQLQDTISKIETTYQKAVKVYEALLNLKSQTTDTDDMDAHFAASLSELSQRDYVKANSDLDALNQQISDALNKLAASNAPAQANSTSAPANNTAPGSGYSRQSVNTDRGNFVVDIIAADMGSTKIVVDTASNSNCSNNCPTLPLSDYVSRRGAYAGINGNFFCPAEYPSCAGKTNSFDLLVMNLNKVYFNSSNNVYSTNPVVVFGNGFIRFVGAAENWGRDTSVDGVLSNFPLLVSGGNIVYSDSSDTKFTNKGSRDFVANRGNTAYIGVIYNANMTDAAHIMKSLNMDNAMNLDEGGSTALMFNGSYIAGPGRNIPDAILLLHR